MMILLLIAIIVCLLIWLWFIKKRTKRQHTAYEEQHIKMQAEHAEKEEQYAQFYAEIAEKTTKEKETRKRRYVSQKDKNNIRERDMYTCQICGISKSYLDSFVPGLGDWLLLETDHIISVKQGGSGDDIDNLQTLCWRCNRKKSAKKTNEDVKNSIDYGIHMLAPSRTLTNSEILRSQTFMSLNAISHFMTARFGIPIETTNMLIKKVKQANLSSEEEIKLASNIFCKLMDENKI